MSALAAQHPKPGGATRASWPRWVEEIHRLLPIRSQFVLSGNVRDLFLTPSASGTQLKPLIDCLWPSLESAGFEFLDDGTAELRPNHTVDGNPMRFAEGPLRITADERWRTDMDLADRRTVSVLTGPLLRRYGYR